MVNDDIRWIQRFQNYKRVLQKLEDAVVLKEERELTDLEKQGEGEIWMEMIQSRNMTTHTYTEDTANEIIETVQHSYLAEFIALKEKLQELSGQ